MKALTSTSTDQYLVSLTKPFGPQVPLEELILRLNDIYHKHEAKRYQTRHPEIFEQLALVWREMLQCVKGLLGGRPLRVLDYGCGTGFELRRLIDGFSVDDIECVNCFDPSPAMLRECHIVAEDAAWRKKIAFTDNARRALAEGPYDLILTNSVMHHIYDYEGVVSSFYDALCADGCWLSGHEPSARFYKNEHCWSLFRQYQRRRAWQRYFSPQRWISRLSANPARLAAAQALREGLFTCRPDAATVSRLVDCWVANDPAEAEAGRGFDYKDQEIKWSGMMRLIRRWTYSYLGPIAQVSATQEWQSRCRELARRYPDDGANYCGAWQKVGK